VLHEYGSEGRLRCPLCLVCWWVDAQESLVFTWDLRHSKLYGRPGPPAKESIETVSDRHHLRGRLRKYAIHVLHVSGARYMEVEELVPLIALTFDELQARLTEFEVLRGIG